MAYQRKDAFYARAKAEGYRSRAAYKLVELARRYQLLKRGDHVVDLGAWPGGWLQVAADLVGPRGIVVGVDLEPINPVGRAWVSTLVGDASEPAVLDELRQRCQGRVDVVLSDMSPKLSGIRDRDAARAAELSEVAVAIADQLVTPGGRLLMKVFSSAEGETLMLARRVFSAAKLTKPEASRRESTEMYLVGTGRRPQV
jgi:23S rRNA (uridine2552-2'-O)-methyltransferase